MTADHYIPCVQIIRFYSSNLESCQIPCHWLPGDIIIWEPGCDVIIGLTQKCCPFGGPTVMTYKMMDGVGLRCCSEARGTSDRT